MPLYTYQCLDCQTQDARLGGLDDHTALCHVCGGLMLRLDDPFAMLPLASLRLGENSSPEATHVPDPTDLEIP